MNKSPAVLKIPEAKTAKINMKKELTELCQLVNRISLAQQGREAMERSIQDVKVRLEWLIKHI